MAKRKQGEGGDKGEDGALFRRALADVAPLKKRPKARVGDAAGPTSPKPPPAKQAAQPTPRPVPRVARRAGTPTGAAKELEIGATAGIDRRTADRFRRGRMAIEGRLDLHGLYQEEAHEALRGFIAGAAARGQRCVLVVTGKGRVSQGGGVLRRAVPKWLNQPGLREHILSIAQARIEDGGDGAIYVLLKRRR